MFILSSESTVNVRFCTIEHVQVVKIKVKSIVLYNHLTMYFNTVREECRELS